MFCFYGSKTRIHPKRLINNMRNSDVDVPIYRRSRGVMFLVRFFPKS